MAIKDSAEKWVQGKPMQAIISVAAIGILVGGLVGLGAGFKIEQNRTRSDVDRLKAQLSAAGTNGTVDPTGPLGQRTGKVKTTGTDTIDITTKRQGDQEIRTTPTTVIERAVKGSTADIAVGKRVLVTILGRDVIVLSDTSKLGRKVVTVSSDSFTLEKPNGERSGELPLTKVKVVNTIAPAKFADIKANDTVFAGGRTAGKGAFSAVEVIILDPNSGFAN